MTMTETASGFRAPTVPAPDDVLEGVDAIRALLRNPIEAMPRALFREPYLTAHHGGKQIVWLADPDGFETVLRAEADNFPKNFIEHRMLAPVLGEGLLTSEGAHWRWQRRAAAPEFSPRRVLAFAPVFAEAARATAAEWSALADGARRDVAADMQRATLKAICESMLSGESGFDLERFGAAVTRYLDTYGRLSWFDVLRVPAWAPRPRYPMGFAALRYLRKEARRVVSERRARGPGDPPDLLDLLFAAQDPDTARAMSDAELVDNVLTIVDAGHETTALALTWALYLLACDEAAQTRVAEEARAVLGDRDAGPDDVDKLVFTKQVIQESMRLYPPVAAMGRNALEDTVVSGLKVEKGAQVLLGVYPLHRHERWWSEPETFEPDRFSPARSEGRHRFQYVPFSAGPRICIGATFAMAEAQIILASLMRDFRIAPDPEHRIWPVLRITMRPEGGMPLFITRRN